MNKNSGSRDEKIDDCYEGHLSDEAKHVRDRTWRRFFALGLECLDEESTAEMAADPTIIETEAQEDFMEPEVDRKPFYMATADERRGIRNNIAYLVVFANNMLSKDPDIKVRLQEGGEILDARLLLSLGLGQDLSRMKYAGLPLTYENLASILRKDISRESRVHIRAPSYDPEDLAEPHSNRKIGRKAKTQGYRR